MTVIEYNLCTPHSFDSQLDFLIPRVDDVLFRISELVKKESLSIPTVRKEQYSQYFTESAVAQQMAKMLTVRSGAVIGDHGAVGRHCARACG